MAILPSKTLVEQIDSNHTESSRRTYIGYSSAGATCGRAVWYGFYWVSNTPIEARLQRIFDTGHYMEDIMIKDLEGIGIHVHSTQLGVVGPHEHILGHIDGLADVGEVEHLVEFKTMNDKSFKNLLKVGLMKAKRSHYSQMQAYMGKLDLTKGLYMAYNKNDSSYYIEIIDFDKDEFDMRSSFLSTILYSEFPPDKIGEKTWFECKYCNFKDICHNNAPVDMNCRTCKYFAIENKGLFSCGRSNAELSRDDQLKGCDKYETSEFLI